MSLINKMLQDLDKRGAAPQSIGSAGHDIHVVAGGEPHRPKARTAGMVLAIPVLAMLSWAVWNEFRPAAVQKPATQAPATVAATAPAPAAPVAQTAPVSAEAVAKAEPQISDAKPAAVERTADTAATGVVAAKPQAAAEPVSKPTAPPQATIAAAKTAPAAVVEVKAADVRAVATTTAAAEPAKPAAPVPPIAKTVAPSPVDQKPVDARKQGLAAAEAPKAPAPAQPTTRATSTSHESPKGETTHVARASTTPSFQEERKAPAQKPDATTNASATAAPSADKQPTVAKPHSAGEPSIDRRLKQAEPQDPVQVEFLKAVSLMNQGRVMQAIDTYDGVLRLRPTHTAARQAMVALLVETKRLSDAQRALRDGLALTPAETGWAMLLARIQLETGDAPGAIETLKTYASYAKERGDYHAFLGRLLQMQSRNKEALEHYEIAVRQSPGAGPWLTGLGISLEAESRVAEAREAYQRALATRTLDNELQAYVERKLKQLQ